VSSDAVSDPSASAGYVQRAELLAELGRYDEAVEELAAGLAQKPRDVPMLHMLARVHLAAGRAADALAAVDAALALAPARIPLLALRGLALMDLRRFTEAAEVAGRILALAPTDPYAQRAAAAILAGSRNGQPALDAAWRAVELAPREAQAHLVLALVATGLHLFDLAERAYREALELDPTLGEADRDVGVIRLERRWYAAALAEAAEAATAYLPPIAASPETPTGAPSAGTPETPRAAEPLRFGPPTPDRIGLAGLAGMRPNPKATSPLAEPMRRFLLFGAGYAIVGALLVAFLAPANGAVSRVFAVVVALLGGAVLWAYGQRVPNLRGALRARADRPLAAAGWAVIAAPALILAYALVGTVWPLVAALIAATVAEIVIFQRR
jgi:tetratricopeptide (TPR) repeat protein